MLGEPEEVWQALEVWNEALVAHFAQAAARRGDRVTVEVAGSVVTVEATGPNSTTHAGRWIDAFESCLIRRSRTGFDTICSVPRSVFFGRPPIEVFDAEPFIIAWADMLRAMYLRTGETATLYLRALELTDPEHVRIDMDLVLHVYVPALEVYLRVFEKESDPFNETLERAIESHRRYWSDEERAHHWDGMLAIPLLAASCLANDTGLSVEVDSPYVPLYMVKAEPE